MINFDNISTYSRFILLGEVSTSCTNREAARKASIKPIFSDMGICSLRRSGQGRTSIATSVTKLGML